MDLVTGATGFIGQHVVEHLLLEGSDVRVLTRGDRSFPQSWLGHVDVVYGDLNDSKALQKAVEGCELVFHFAAELRDFKQMDRVNIEGTNCLLEACDRAGINKLIHLSSVGVMGVTRKGNVDEREPCTPRNNYERSKFVAEKLVLAWSKNSGKQTIVIRPTNVFGDGPHGGSDSMLAWLKAIKQGIFVFFSRRAISNYVYVKDVADACCSAAKMDASGVFIVNDFCPLADFVSAASAALGVPAPKIFIPAPFSYVTALLFQVFFRLARRNSPLTLSRVRALSSRTCYLSNRIRETWGWFPSIGYKIGLQRTVDWYRQMGKL